MVALLQVGVDNLSVPTLCYEMQYTILVSPHKCPMPPNSYQWEWAGLSRWVWLHPFSGGRVRLVALSPMLPSIHGSALINGWSDRVVRRSRLPQISRLLARTTLIAIHIRTKPTISEYSRSHFDASLDASFLFAALVSRPAIPLLFKRYRIVLGSLFVAPILAEL